MKIIKIESINLYKIAFRNKYDLISNNYCTQIFELVKNNFIGSKSIQLKELEDNCFLILLIEKTIIEHLNHGNFGFSAYTIKKPEYINIEINIRLNNKFSEKDYQKFYSSLYEIVRHEFEHVNKNLNDIYPDDSYSYKFNEDNLETLSDQVHKYITNPIEIDSYVRSIIYTAKKRHISYKEILKEVVSRAFFNNNAEIEENCINNKIIQSNISNTIKVIEERIKEIYPNVIRMVFR